jgi:hypothetical protein
VRLILAAIVASGLSAAASPVAAAQPQPSGVREAQAAFYNARYEEAAAMLSDSCTTSDIEACELRSSALHFELKRAVGDAKDKGRALKQCVKCPAILEAFLRDTARGQALARTRLQEDPTNESALFFLGKLNLNYAWMQAGTLGRRTGLGEYREARRSLDALLKRNPGHLRARVARAWMDYIIDTRMPRGTKWIFGGGNKRRALTVMREAAKAEAELYASAEARFGLWDMLVRERQVGEAVAVARALATDFPANADLAKFLQTHGSN